MQLDAPESRRGRFIGAYSTMSMGLRAGSGILIGVLATLLGVTAAVAIDAIALLAVAFVLLIIVLVWLHRRRDIDPDATVAIEQTGPQPVAE